MRLNPDCVRDILLACEQLCTPTAEAVFNDDSPLVIDGRTYQRDEVLYHLNQCRMNGFFVECTHDPIGNYFVRDITPKAHEFLANIREDTNWNKVKETAKKTGAGSLAAIKDIAAQVIAALIASQFSP